jgi:hypothetical protein
MIPLFLKGDARIFYRMGYYSDQDGILRRYQREAMQWENHLTATRSAILSAVPAIGHKKVAILGSGWLLDVPFGELVKLFDKVWLFDIRHSRRIKRLASSYPNVFLKETDLSGYAKGAWNLAKSGAADFHLSPSFDFDLSDFDFVVSCNLLNQLDILIVDFLQNHVKMTQEEENQLRKNIQQTHLNLLPKGKSCIVTDVEELWMDKHNQHIGNRQLVHIDLPLQHSREWIWHFDNHCTYNARHNTWFKVLAGQI